MNLIVIQREFRDYLRDAPNQVAQLVNANADARLNVYHHAFRARLDDCLKDAFPKCWSYLGDEGFAQACEQHRMRCEPSSWTLDAYGNGFETTLASIYPDDPEIAELAWLEWALRTAFDAQDREALSQEDFAATDWDVLAPAFHPTLKLTEFEWNSAEIWSALNAENAPPVAQTLQLPTTLMVWRNQLVPQFRSVTGFERDMVRLFLNGESFAQACESVFGDMESEQAVPLIAAIFHQWVHDGLLVRT